MTTIALDRVTNNYWNLIKTASDKEKLMLIAMLSSSLADGDGNVAIETKTIKAHRRNALSDEEMEQLITGTPLPLTSDGDANIQDIVEAHQGRIAKGLEKWL